MQHRMLMGCVIATAVLLGANVVIHLFAVQLNRAVLTSLGEIPIADLIAVFVAMLAGAAIARRPFRWMAIVIATLVWLATAASLTAQSDLGVEFGRMLRYSTLGLVLSWVSAWLGAWAGERLTRANPG